MGKVRARKDEQSKRRISQVTKDEQQKDEWAKLESEKTNRPKDE